MQELRFVAVSEDGSYAVLAVPGRSARFVLPIDEKLRAVALGQTSRLAQYEIEVESPLRPKEIQARIRAGETAEEIADAAGIPVERVRWFEGPVLAERAYIAQQAQTASVRRHGDSAGPGPRLGEVVTERMVAVGADPEEGQWDSRKRGDGTWQVQLTYSAGGRLHIAEWVFDPRRRHVMPEDETAARLSLPESELPPEPETLPGEATVTPIASRLGAAAGMGGGSMTPVSGGGRFRSERPERPPVPERHAPERYAPERRAPERHAPDRPAPGDRHDSPERPAAYAQPSSPVSPRPVSPAPAHRDTERPVAPPPPPSSPGRSSGAPWRAAPLPREAQDYRDELPYQAPQDYLGSQEYEESQDYRERRDYHEEPRRPVAFEPEPEPTLPFDNPPVPADGAPPAPPADYAPAPAAPGPGPEPEPVTEAEAEPEPPAKAEAPAKPPETPVKPETGEPEPAGAKSPEAEAADTKIPDTKIPDTKTAEAKSPEAKPAVPKAPAAKKPAPKASPAKSRAANGAASKAPAKAAAAKKEPAKEEPAVTEKAVTEKAATEPAAAEDSQARPRPAKKNPRGRRSSVPSWDEIMLGSSRQRD